MTHSLILLLYRHMALVIFRTVIAVVKQEFGKFYIAVSMTVTLHVIDKSAEPDQRLFHLLVTVILLLLFGSDIGNPAIRKLLGSIIKPGVSTFGKGIVVNS